MIQLSRSWFRQHLLSQYGSCLAPHMNFWLKLPYLQPPNDLFPPLFCLLKLVQPIGILTFMNESSLRLDLTSSYLYSFRELNSFPQLLLNLLLFRSKQLPCCFRVFVKLSLAFRLRLLGSKSIISSSSCKRHYFCFVVCDRSSCSFHLI
ncbi:Hypothetical_protein [Hexamita inflata]|uniref:Hypothetical_protein n=1 Tax=Hexamita inflata TaxID=28002 RepID=A0AA86QI45_9EUKA|nr:Hypothetical protein HINF_LOCUS47494 [Hexamita inflata]